MTAAIEARTKIRHQTYTGPTADLAPGFVQANLVVLPREYIRDFLSFAKANPKPCPIIEVIEHGTEAAKSTPGSDLRTDLPGYRLFEHGIHVDSAKNALEWWREDLVSVLLGCSFTFEAALIQAGVPVRHIELARNVPMFITNRNCKPAGKFSGPLVVSMRPIPPSQIDLTKEITENFPHAHGGPVHIGEPSDIGITDLGKPDFGDAVPVHGDEVPMFWACGVTPQLAVRAAAPDIAITHEPGQMFITDLFDVYKD
ncbi:MAG: putative hydro-lyase [Gammaproteobacteria bacterium]